MTLTKNYGWLGAHCDGLHNSRQLWMSLKGLSRQREMKGNQSRNTHMFLKHSSRLLHCGIKHTAANNGLKHAKPFQSDLQPYCHFYLVKRSWNYLKSWLSHHLFCCPSIESRCFILLTRLKMFLFLQTKSYGGDHIDRSNGSNVIKALTATAMDVPVTSSQPGDILFNWTVIFRSKQYRLQMAGHWLRSPLTAITGRSVCAPLARSHFRLTVPYQSNCHLLKDVNMTNGQTVS